MELYAAIDLHSNNSVLVVTDAEDHVVFAKRLSNDLQLIVTALRGCVGEVQAVAVESTYNLYWLVDGLREAGFCRPAVALTSWRTRTGGVRRHRLEKPVPDSDAKPWH